MKTFRVTRKGVHTRVYAVVGRDGTVLWHIRPAMGTELSKTRALEVAKQHGAEVVPADYRNITKEDMQTGHLLRQAAGACPDCGGNCDEILAAMKTSYFDRGQCEAVFATPDNQEDRCQRKAAIMDLESRVTYCRPCFQANGNCS